MPRKIPDGARRGRLPGPFPCQFLLALIERQAAALAVPDYRAVSNSRGAGGLQFAHTGRDCWALVTSGSSIPIDRSAFIEASLMSHLKLLSCRFLPLNISTSSFIPLSACNLSN